MTPSKIDPILSLMEPDEVHDALRLIDAFERWNMPAAEADEWRRRIVGRQRFLDLPPDSSLK